MVPLSGRGRHAAVVEDGRAGLREGRLEQRPVLMPQDTVMGAKRSAAVRECGLRQESRDRVGGRRGSTGRRPYKEPPRYIRVNWQ